MQYLILGASGFIGSRIYNNLSSDITHYPESNQVWGTYHYREHPDLVPYDIYTDSFESLISRTELNLSEPFFVINSAFSGNLELCAQFKDKTRHLNINRTCEFAKAVHEAGGDYVYLSSGYVFAGDKESSYQENDDIHPVCEYGFQKGKVEEFLSEQLPCSLIFRLGTVVDYSPVNDHLLSDWFRMIQAGQTIKCIQRKKFSLSCVDQISSVISRLTKQKQTGIWHISATPCEQSAVLLTQNLARLMGVPAQHDIQPPQDQFNTEPRPLNTSLDCQRLIYESDQVLFRSVDSILNNFQWMTGRMPSLFYKRFGETLFYTANPEILVIYAENEPHSLRRHSEF